MASVGSSGISSSSVCGSGAASPNVFNSLSSSSENPKISKSKSSSESSFISRASISSSQPALSAILLSAITKALRWVSLK